MFPIQCSNFGLKIHPILESGIVSHHESESPKRRVRVQFKQKKTLIHLATLRL